MRRVVAIAVVLGVGSWLVWLAGLGLDDRSGDVDGNVLGVDHSIFHTAGRLVVDGRAVGLYDAAAFNAELADVRGEAVAEDVPLFRNPPALAWLFAVTAGIPVTLGWLLLGAAGVIGLVAAFRLVGVRRAATAALLTLATIPALFTFRLGQLAFLWALAFAAVFWLLRQDRQVAAGVVAGVLALKPQLLAPVLLWWLLDLRNYRPALLAGLGSGLALTVIGFAITPGSWSGFWDATLGDTLVESQFPGGFSLNDTILELAPGLPVVAVTALTVALGIAALVAAYRCCCRDLPAMFAAAVFVAVWSSPHVLPYEWTLLGVAVGALWASRPSQRGTWLIVGAAIAIWAWAAWNLALVIDELFDVRLQLAAPGLATIAITAYRWLPGSAADSRPAETRTIPVDV